MVGSQHQIAFVFPVFFVHQDDHAAGTQIGNDVIGRGNGGRGAFSHVRAFVGKCGSVASMRST